MAAMVVLAFLVDCGGKRDMDLMGWSRPGWSPIDEDRDFGECDRQAAKAAYRKYHWRRQALSRDAEGPTPRYSPATLRDKLQDLSEDERRSRTEIAEECMNERGYKLVPINQAIR